MSTVVVLGAAGTAGRRIVTEVATRGHHTIAAIRQPNPDVQFPDGVVVKTGDATSAESVRELASGADAVVLAIGGEGSTLVQDAAATIAETLKQMPAPRPRIIHMGGGATLTDPDGTRFLDLPTFPAEYREAAADQAAALDYYRSLNGDVSWTYVSPPPVNFQPATRTGRYRTGSDQPVTDANGDSTLSYEDFAVVIADEIETPVHLNQRFTAGY